MSIRMHPTANQMCVLGQGGILRLFELRRFSMLHTGCKFSVHSGGGPPTARVSGTFPAAQASTLSNGMVASGSQLGGGGSRLLRCDFSPDGQFITACGEDGRLYVCFGLYFSLLSFSTPRFFTVVVLE